MIERELLNNIRKNLFKGKAILLFGARQTGKTTLVNEIVREYGNSCLMLNADEPDIRLRLNNATSTELKNLIGNAKLLIIDEAQRIINSGLTLKLITDNLKDVQLIATGSSAFELADKIKESLTGRCWEYNLFPFSIVELTNHFGALEESRLLENRLIYGFYPEVINHPGNEKQILNSITDSILFKDLYALEKVKKPATLEKLLQALSLQAGNEVSYSELSQIIEADKETVERYIYLLEKSFIVFRLYALSRNVRNELKRSRKIYFYDNGIRNSIIANFSPLDIRSDKGALWENFLVAERMKLTHYNNYYCKKYFWRTTQQQEIDYIEEHDGNITAYEFKYKPHPSFRFPATFRTAYPGSEYQLINSNNYLNFVNSINL